MKSTRTRIVVATVVTLAVALTLIGCPKAPPPTAPSVRPPVPPTAAVAPQGEPVKIGAIFSVTGPASPLGEPEKNAVEMLVVQVNEAGGVLGRPLEVIIKDDGSMPDGAVKAANDLIEQGVVAIIGPSRTPTTMPLKEICQEAGVPLISCAAGKTITDPVASYVFAVPQTNTLAVAKCFEYLDKQGIDKVASIYVANAFGEDGQNNIEAIAADKGVEIVATETFGGDDTVMETQLTKIKAAGPDALICWGTNPGPALVTKQAKTIGLDVPILQSHGVANMQYIEQAGEAANGVQLPAGRLIVWDQLPDDDSFKGLLEEFADAYQAKYGQAPNTFAGHFKYSAEDHNGLTLDAFVWVEIVDGGWKLAP